MNAQDMKNESNERRGLIKLRRIPYREDKVANLLSCSNELGAYLQGTG